MSNTHIRIGGTVAALLAGTLALWAQESVRFQNTTPILATYANANRYEFGDEIILQGYQAGVLYGLTSFEFQLRTQAGFVEAPGKKLTFHIYTLDGIPNPAPVYSTPGTEVFASTPLPLVENGGWPSSYTIGYAFDSPDMPIVPGRFVWSVSCTGLDPGDSVALDIAGQMDGTVQIGTDPTDFWIKEPQGWVLSIINNGDMPANFYAKVLTIPEPTPVQLLLLAGAGGIGLWLIRRRA